MSYYQPFQFYEEIFEKTKLGVSEIFKKGSLQILRYKFEIKFFK